MVAAVPGGYAKNEVSMSNRPSSKKFFSIGEAGKIAGLEPHVLRFWESEFRELAPKKNEAGRRVYSQADVDVILKLRDLLHVRKFTIEGAKKYLSGKPEIFGRNQPSLVLDENYNSRLLSEVKNEIEEILRLFEDKS